MPSKPWFRLYHTVADDPKVQRLSAELFRSWINVLCIASRQEGVLPAMDDLAFGLRCSVAEAALTVEALVTAGLIDTTGWGHQIHGWHGRQFTSDSSTPRVQRFRVDKTKRFRNVSGSVSETLDETDQSRADTEQSRTEQIQNRTEQKADNGAVAPRPPYSTGFELFWSAYPKAGKDDKAGTYKEYCKHKPDGMMHMAMMAGITRWEASRRWQEGFVVNAKRWMKERRWEAEPEPATANGHVEPEEAGAVAWMRRHGMQPEVQ